MILTLFKNQKGLIHGSDPKRIQCETAGILKIGKTEITVFPNEEVIMPMLFHGVTGDYEAIFTTTDEQIYHLEKVQLRNGWIQSPNPMTVELMELRLRTEIAEEKIQKLENLFDTNALNFLVK